VTEPQTRTKYLYDDLNRLVGITYPTVPSGVSAMPNVCKVNGAASNNANVCYTYGTTATGYQNGRVVAINDPSGSESYTYDQFGNVTQLAKVIGTSTYSTSYMYNLANELIQITYPSGRIVQQSVDAIGRLCEIAPSTSGCGTASSPFATGFGYNAANGVIGFKYGNGIFASFGFSSDRLQMNCLDYSTANRGTTCTHDSTTKFGLGYSYQTAPSNNGQISGITDSVDSGRNATYTYDSLDRLTNASTAGSTNYPAWGLGETYDRYGNRSIQAVSSGCTGITCPTSSVTINTATNRISGSPYTYDLSGNMTNDGQNTLVYDAENRTVSATVTGSSSGTYTYDGKGLRVQRVSVVSGTTTTTVYVFSNSKVIAEYDNGALPSAPTREYVYAGGKLLTKIDTTGTKYYHQDHVSNRLVTDSSGNTVTQMGHFPFGESWYNSTQNKLVFTSYERDAESGNDYAKARYYISRLARFSSPDPVAGDPSNPQSWNRYSYVLNDPINLNDPEGEYCNYLTDDGSGSESIDTDSTDQECSDNGGSWVPDGPDDSANDGGNGGQCDADCQLQAAEQAALNALSNPDCANAVDRGSGVAASTLLVNLAVQNNDPENPASQAFSLGSIGFADLGPYTIDDNLNVRGVAARTSYPSAPGNPNVPGGPVSIQVNSNAEGAFIAPLLPAYNSTLITNAMTILHELGHASYDFGFGSSVLPDAGNASQSMANADVIDANCFGPSQVLN
jgi:RHS repeat-associated protein